MDLKHKIGIFWVHTIRSESCAAGYLTDPPFPPLLLQRLNRTIQHPARDPSILVSELNI